MLYRGLNKEGMFTEAIDMNFELVGNQKCMQEFRPTKMQYCGIFVKKGGLLLRNSKISLDGIAKEMNAKIPAVAVLENNNILVKRTFLKGDTTNGAMTAGIYGLKCNL